MERFTGPRTEEERRIAGLSPLAERFIQAGNIAALTGLQPETQKFLKDSQTDYLNRMKVGDLTALHTFVVWRRDNVDEVFKSGGLGSGKARKAFLEQEIIKEMEMIRSEIGQRRGSLRLSY